MIEKNELKYGLAEVFVEDLETLPDVKMSLEDDEDETDENKYKNANKKPVNKDSKTPILDSFSRDLTKLAQEGKIDPIIGRDKEIERVSQILCRRRKNNPILLGEPGTGKTAIAEGLALRITQRKVSRTLFNKRVVCLDIASIVAGTKYRGQMEERTKSLLAELEKNPDVILFIDEIHTMVGAGGASGSLDASNMFKPALSRGELQIIGATTLDEYRKFIEKDGALERRFQKVLVESATEEETIQIIQNIKDKYEEHHNVIYTEEAIKACVSLTSRYMTERQLPDKAIDALDEAGSRVHISNIVVPKEITDIEAKIAEVGKMKVEVVRQQKYEAAAEFRDTERQLIANLEEMRKKWEEDQKNQKQLVREEDVAQVVSMITGIPLQKVNTNENEKLVNMEENMTGKVIGQDHAVKKVVKSIKRGRIGLKDPNKPTGVFLFLGESGSGKCITKDTFVTIRNKKTGEIEKKNISDIIYTITATKVAQ